MCVCVWRSECIICRHSLLSRLTEYWAKHLRHILIHRHEMIAARAARFMLGDHILRLPLRTAYFCQTIDHFTSFENRRISAHLCSWTLHTAHLRTSIIIVASYLLFGGAKYWAVYNFFQLPSTMSFTSQNEKPVVDPLAMAKLNIDTWPKLLTLIRQPKVWENICIFCECGFCMKECVFFVRDVESDFRTCAVFLFEFG